MCTCKTNLLNQPIDQLNFFLTPASFEQIQIPQCANNNPVHKFRHPHHLYRAGAHNGRIINVTDVEKQGKKLDGKRCSGVTGTRNAIENNKTQCKTRLASDTIFIPGIQAAISPVSSV